MSTTTTQNKLSSLKALRENSIQVVRARMSMFINVITWLTLQSWMIKVDSNQCKSKISC